MKKQTEIALLQEERGKIYGDFKTHCEKVSEIVNFSPADVGIFYIASKQVRWENCPTKANYDSVIDWLSYVDLFKKAFPDLKSDLFSDEKIKSFEAILKDLKEK